MSYNDYQPDYEAEYEQYAAYQQYEYEQYEAQQATLLDIEPAAGHAGPGLESIDLFAEEEPHPMDFDLPEPPGAPTLDDARALLQRYWGYSDFRPGQDQCIEAIMQGRDVVGILPTGAGKSIVYQVSALLLPGTTIVVSPLISLMQDQIDGLLRRKVPAAFINSSLKPSEMEERMRWAEEGRLKLLYVAPERFDSISFRERIKKVFCPLLAVDEAHCLSEWGHDFRPAYMRIGKQRELLGFPQILALTATATPQVREDIVRHMALENPFVHVGSFDRPNLSWRSLSIDVSNRDLSQQVRLEMIERELRGLKGGSAVIYAGTRKNVEMIAGHLQSKGFNAIDYHGGFNSNTRTEAQDAFMSGEANIVVATNAFGMGVDKPDVRKVIHYQIPGTIEAYYQEGGRAGRDGKESDCLLLFDEKDAELQEMFISMSHPPDEWYAYVYRALEQHADEEGRVVHRDPRGNVRIDPATGDVHYMTTSDLVRAQEWPDINPVSAVLMNLHAAGVVEYTSSSSNKGVYVRLTKSPEEIKEILDGKRVSEDHKLTMRELWKVGGGRKLYDGVVLRERHISQFQGEYEQLKKTLDYMKKKEALEVQTMGTRIKLLKPGLLTPRDPATRLPLPWAEIAERRKVEHGKLERMMDYARTRGCRRGDILGYFKDPNAMDFCGKCDNCAKREAEAA